MDNFDFRLFNKILISFILVSALTLGTWYFFLRSDEPYSPAISTPVETPTPAPVEAPATLPPETPAPPPTPTPTPTPEPEPEYFTISMVGDCTLSASSDKVSWGIGFQKTVNGNWAYPFANTVSYLNNDYLTIANLECNLSNSHYTSPTYEWFTFLSDANYANILKEGSVEFATLANNHTMDFGEKALRDTESALDAVGVAHAGENQCYIYQQENGPKLGIYCLYNQLTANALELWTKDRQRKQIDDSKLLISLGAESLKSQGAEFLIICLHMGKEGYYEPTEEQNELCRYAADCGFGIVYCSHAHRLQPSESYNGAVIYYGLGNWSFGGHTNPGNGNDKGAYDTGIAQVTLCRKGASITVSSSAFVPCSISSASGVNNYQPTPYEQGSAAYERTMSMLNGTYDGANYLTNYQNIVY